MVQLRFHRAVDPSESAREMKLWFRFLNAPVAYLSIGRFIGSSGVELSHSFIMPLSWPRLVEEALRPRKAGS
jgi:hypothetical protein